MRKYQQLWEILKQHKKAAIIADPKFHRRIRKAVAKERCEDLEFKVDLEMNGKIAYVKGRGSKKNPKVLEFNLEIKPDLKEI